MNTPIETPHNKRNRMTPIIILLIAFCIGISYYAWHQRKGSLSGLESLKKNGVEITFTLLSRPLLAVDKKQKKLYLIKGKEINTTTVIAFHNINNIIFKEKKGNNRNNNKSIAPDSLTIHTLDGIKYRVGDLPGLDKGAYNAFRLFRQHEILTEHLVFKSR